MKLIKSIPNLIRLAVKSILERKSLYMSQAGQDIWVFGEVFNEMRNGYFVDIGAHDGIYLSNTYILECKYGWKGICVEANPSSFKLLKINRRAICVNACLDGTERFVDFAKWGVIGGIIEPDKFNKDGESCEVVRVKTQTLNNLLKEMDTPPEVDYLSIDIEGAEESVLKEFNFNDYLFKCITIERPTDTLKKIFTDNGYILIKEIPFFECFYVHERFFGQYCTNLFDFYSKKYLVMRWK
ncbi:MAG: FkbM family methyltransferase [Smithella sp.]|jgi:FkbM family methyltransferase|nr:FkbM family methyltransferase [Smithella sp.]